MQGAQKWSILIVVLVALKMSHFFFNEMFENIEDV